MATLRFQTSGGMLRLNGVNLAATSVHRLKQLLAAAHGIPAETCVIKLGPRDEEGLADNAMLSSLGLSHGSLLYLSSPVALSRAPSVKKVVDAEGNVVALGNDVSSLQRKEPISVDLAQVMKKGSEIA